MKKERKSYNVVDHEGREFHTQKEMVEYWGKGERLYCERMKMEWTKEEALVVPPRKNREKYMESYRKEKEIDGVVEKKSEVDESQVGVDGVKDDNVVGEENEAEEFKVEVDEKEKESKPEHDVLNEEWYWEMLRKEAEELPDNDYEIKQAELQGKARENFTLMESIESKDLTRNFGYREDGGIDDSSKVVVALTGDDVVEDKVLLDSTVPVESDRYGEPADVVIMEKDMVNMVGDVHIMSYEEIYVYCEKEIMEEFPNLKVDNRERFYELLEKRAQAELDKAGKLKTERAKTLMSPEIYEMIANGRMDEDSRKRIAIMQENKNKEVKAAERVKEHYGKEIPLMDFSEVEENALPFRNFDEVRRESMIKEIKYPTIERDLSAESLEMIEQEIYSNRMVLRRGTVGTRVVIPEVWLKKIGFVQVMSVRGEEKKVPRIDLYVLGAYGNANVASYFRVKQAKGSYVIVDKLTYSGEYAVTQKETRKVYEKYFAKEYPNFFD